MKTTNASPLRRAAKRVPGLRYTYCRLRIAAVDVRDRLNLLRLRTASRHPFEGDPSSNIVVSLTSFPARIQHAWIAIETMFQQRRPPAKVVLVLAEQEFPDRTLPPMIRDQEKRGLEILWVPRNMRSYKKLLPTRAAYPDARIVTVDDDIFYEPWRLGQLIEEADQHPGAIIGHRGWIVTGGPEGLAPYADWPPADRLTPPDRVFLTSGAGTLYPPGVLAEDLLLNIDLAERLCPTADDIWFWAMAKLSGAPLICLGNHALRLMRQQQSSPGLASVNWGEGQNDVQLRRAIDHFALWDSVLASLKETARHDGASLPA